jgi:hypothetical protein
MNIKKKIALAAVPAVMALSATDASSKVLLMSDSGWEISFDGAANAFYNFSSTGVVDTTGLDEDMTSKQTSGAGIITDAGGMNGEGGGQELSGISVGLLPNVWGFTVKAPTKNGLDVSGRLGFYTHMNNRGNSANGNIINTRETSLTVAGSFGSVLMGRSLGIHGSNAILNDMTLFGVGTFANNAANTTTLGRIGAGYVYADWYPQFTWTTPGLGPIGAKIAIMSASQIHSNAGADATETHAPKVEAQLDYNFNVMDLGVYVWVDGSYQNVGRSTAEGAQYLRDTSIDGGANLTPGGDYDESIDVGALGFGTKMTFQGLTFVASGFWNHGLGLQFQGNLNNAYSGSLDDRGKARNFYGGYLQATYDFGQGTNIGYSYGQNKQVLTGHDAGAILEDYTTASGNALTSALVNYQESHIGMVWHNVTDDFRIIAEGGVNEMHWYGGGSQEQMYTSVGAFFFW